MNRLTQITPGGTDIGEVFGSPFGTTKGVGDLISFFVSTSIVLAGVIMLFLFIGGGLMIITSAGSNDPHGAARGKQAVSAAIIGFVVVVVAYLIIRVIELVTGTIFLTGFGSVAG